MTILPATSKTYKRLMYDQTCKYFDQIFSKFQCGFCKEFSTHNCLWKFGKNLLDQGDHYGGPLTDLSTAFDNKMHVNSEAPSIWLR